MTNDRFPDNSSVNNTTADTKTAKDNENGSSSQISENELNVFSTVLNQSLDCIQAMSPDVPPDLVHFSALVVQTKHRERRRLMRDLALFVSLALLILAGWTASMRLDTRLFVAITVVVSALSLIALPLITYVTNRHSEAAST